MRPAVERTVCPAHGRWVTQQDARRPCPECGYEAPWSDPATCDHDGSDPCSHCCSCWECGTLRFATIGDEY
jgi:hypothetical protein